MNYFLLGFGAVAVVAVGAIDYTEQARRAGTTPGSYGVGAYLATYGARIAPTAPAPEPASRPEQAATAPIAPQVNTTPDTTQDAGPTRVKMSGGRSCLDGSGGHFCGE